MGDELLQHLNEAQRAAVLHTDNPLLILAGAGSGKTRVITVKIAYLISVMRFDPRSILSVTFTNKAAREMRERAIGLEPQAEMVLLKTFHSFCAWFLRRHADLAGLSPNFAIYDDEDSLQVLSSLYPNKQRPLLLQYARLISRAKDACLSPDDPKLMKSELPDFAEVYRAYEEKLSKIGNADFGGLITKTVEVLKNEPAVRSRMHDRFRVILVDEYQDSNHAQFELIQALKGPRSYICVVGDDDQSIYGFRGAEVQNILDFSKTFEGAEILRLTENYRSVEPILKLADAVVAHNHNRLGKTMFTQNRSELKPELWMFGDQDEEVESVIQYAQTKDEVAILYRTNSQSRAFEAALLRKSIPYKIVGTLRFYEREEIKDTLSLLRLIANPLDEISFRRVVNKPARGIGGKSLDLIMEKLGQAQGDLLRASDYALNGMSKKAREGLHAFLNALESINQSLRSQSYDHLGAFVYEALQRTGLLVHYEEEDVAQASTKVQNLEEFINAASIFGPHIEGLVEFLESTELDAQIQSDDNPSARITLITMHNTKGLEYNNVVISGLEEGTFPRADDSDAELEEQRRLLYVGITRARRELVMTYTQKKRVYGRYDEFLPSRFIKEMPEDLIVTKATSSYRPIMRREYESEGDDYEEGSFLSGDEVRHESFGRGIVVESAVKNGIERVVIRFEDGKSRVIIPDYSPLVRL